MSKPNLKTLINNIKSNKVYTKNISTSNEYGFNVGNKISSDKLKYNIPAENSINTIPKKETSKFKERGAGKL